ncbi:MAG: hypothetical protein M3O20_05930, partial [Acidobacteriota bacterium]|nr:hypothetical protein [Acidobacteriota bacterium]
MEIIRQDLEPSEKDEIERVRKEALPTMDSIDYPEATEAKFTKEDFESALKKASRKISTDRKS